MWHLAGNTWHCSSYQTCKCSFNNKSEVKMWKNKGWGTKWKVRVLAGLHKHLDTFQSTHKRGNVVRPFPKVMKVTTDLALVSKLIKFYSACISLSCRPLLLSCEWTRGLSDLKNRRVWQAQDKTALFLFPCSQLMHPVVSECESERGIPWFHMTSAWCPFPYRETI